MTRIYKTERLFSVTFQSMEDKEYVETIYVKANSKVIARDRAEDLISGAAWFVLEVKKVKILIGENKQ